VSTDQVVVEAFTELAPSYEETVDRELRTFWGTSYEEFINHLVDGVKIGEGDLVLDVATGTAVIPLRLADKVAPSGQVAGIDITPDMLTLGRSKVEAACSSSCISLVCGSAMQMPFAEGVFDVAVCALGMHHMDAAQMLAEMRRVLKRGGRLVMADVGASAFWRSFLGVALLKILLIRYGLAYRSARARAEVEAFGNVRTAGEWLDMLLDCGFEEIEIAESRARRPWYPCGLTMKAVWGGSQGDRQLSSS